MFIIKRLSSQWSPLLNLPSYIRHYNVAVVGGASELGQAACMLLRGEPNITKLTIHDTLPYTTGTIMDISHIPSEPTIKGFTGDANLYKAIEDADIILATGGICETPGIPNKDVFLTNTNYIKNFAKTVSELRNIPFVGIATEPINTLVPIAAEIIRCSGDFSLNKLFGITGIDALRAQSLYAAKCNLNANDCTVHVIGGHSAKTIVPLLSQAMPMSNLDQALIQELTMKIRTGDEIITDAKKGHGPALANAYSVLLFTRAILRALDGKMTPVHAYVENNNFGTSFFSGLVYVDRNGAGEMARYTNLSEFECDLLEESINSLRTAINLSKQVIDVD